VLSVREEPPLRLPTDCYGTAATFTVVSVSEITTTVPAGATTGFVEVITPGGKLKSNTKYRVKL
jgi:hypothetical protein